MKKLIYYLCLFITWFLILLIFSAIFALLGFTNLNFGWAAALGSGCGKPFLMLISAGITMLLRRVWYKIIFKEQKKFDKSLAITFIVIGTFWMIFNVGASMLEKHAEQKLIETYEQSLNK